MLNNEQITNFLSKWHNPKAQMILRFDDGEIYPTKAQDWDMGNILRLNERWQQDNIVELIGLEVTDVHGTNRLLEDGTIELVPTSH